MKTEIAVEIANRSMDAYSAGRYEDWGEVALLLLKHGFNERQTEAIMRSKITRWAGDRWETPCDKYPAEAVMNYVHNYPLEFTRKELNQLIRETWAV